MANSLLQFTLLLAFLFVVSAQSQNINVVDHYGAVGDGQHDNTKIFKDAWKATCKSSSSRPTLHIPAGNNFLLQPLVFSGPCNSNQINVVIDGTLVAPREPSQWSECKDGHCYHWISFQDVDGLSIRGSGMINPQGQKWWTHSCKHHKHSCRNKPSVGFVISNSKNVQIANLTFKDSPKMHIAIEKSDRVNITNINIDAPKHSPNTDGIHIQHSTNVFILQSRIGTGDDCISIGHGSSNLTISNITCGPGHGISIGSLGKHGKYETVENVRVSDIVFIETQNGARIKSWQGGRGYARNIIFERIFSQNADRPIIIDQYYCDHEHCRNQTMAVQISNVVYDQVHGTTSSKTAVKLACSRSFPCRDIWMNDVNIRWHKKGKTAAAYCSNARGRRGGDSVPDVACLNRT